MKRISYISWMIACLMGSILVTLPTQTFAGLGGSVDVYTEQSASAKEAISLHTNATTTSALTSNTTNYTAHALQDNLGTQINEYTNTAGVVFAVTWHGPFKPDLHQLLGDYFPTYVSNAHTTSGRKPTHIEQSQIVINESGRLRNFHGRAYIPNLVPSGVSIDDLN